MMMTTIVLNKHVDGTNCCLIGIVLGVTRKINIPNNNTIQYLQMSPNSAITQYQYRYNRTCSACSLLK